MSVLSTPLSVDSILASVVTGQTLVRLSGLWLAYKITTYLLRLSPFHPLAKFPGPRIAAMTFLYEFWYDFCLGGQYTKRIGQIHEQYGPIVRIGPNELHCLDPIMIDDIYGRPGKVRHKDEHFMNWVIGEQRLSSFGAVSHELHRSRRGPLNQFFSKQRVLQLEDDLRAYVDAFCEKMVRNPTRGKPFDLAGAFTCFTTDMITDYTFGEPIGHLSSLDGWGPNFRDMFSSLITTVYAFRFFPPTRWSSALAPLLRPLLGGNARLLLDEMYVHMPRRVNKVMADHEAGIRHPRINIFTELLVSKLPASERTVRRLASEGFSVNTAGAETTAATLAIVTFYLVKRPDVYQKVLDELKGLGQDPLTASWSKLETLPYLYGVMQESLRLFVGLASRTPRIAPDEDFVYKNTWRGKEYSYVVPRGTVIGMSSGLNHFNPDVYPDPLQFRPERWINPDGSRNREPEKAMTAFSRGTRVCLGLNLAMCELYHMTVAVALRVIPAGLQIHNTEEEDWFYDHDMILALPKGGHRFIDAAMPVRP